MPLLQVSAVSVRFGGLLALQDVDLDVEPDSITGLIGPNGAGKTTLFNVICGLQQASRGSVAFDGARMGDLKPHERARLGIARTFQRLETFGSLTARENVLVAAEIRRGWSDERFDPHSVAEEILDLVDLAAVADERVDTMPTGLARLVELARALAAAPRLLMLDEASSGLTQDETDLMAGLLRRLAAKGLSILLVEHDVEFVMRLCSMIYVLDFGRMIAAGTAKEIQSNAAVQAAYLGSEAIEGDVA